MDKDYREYLVSVIIPAYNAEKYISRAIDSVLNQTLKNIEVIIINDGSTDKTEEIVKTYNEKVRYYYQDNKGVAPARNYGIEKSEGKYIAFLDADDYVLPNAYEEMLQKATTHNSDIVLCGMYFENEKGIRRHELDYKYDRENLNLKNTRDLKKTFQFIGNSSCNKLYRRELIKDLKFPKYKRGEDALFVLECILKSKKIYCVNTPLYVYFQNSASVTKSEINMEVIENHKNVHYEKRELIKRYDKYSILRKDLKIYYVKFFLKYTNRIRRIEDLKKKNECWENWLESNVSDYIKDSFLTNFIKISKNINWVYYIGMLYTGNFIRPILNRVLNIKFYK